MSFSAGGSNVKGVQQIEQGNFIIQSEPTTFAGVGTSTIDITVPAGKKWILKIQGTSVGTFIGTLTSTAIKIYYDAANIITAATGTTSTAVFVLYPQMITLNAGQKVRFEITNSAYTSGQLNCNVGYQEVDV